VQLDDGFLITPTDACLGFLQPDELAFVDASGNQRSGKRASKTLAMHQHIYAAAHGLSPHTRCVIHTHSTHCVALTLRASDQTQPQSTFAQAPELLPALTPYFVMKVGHVPLVPYHRPGSEDAAQHVAQLIRRYAAQGTPIRAVMLPRLGPNVWHDSPAAAMATLEELEETARLMLLAPDTPPLLATDLDALRESFAARW
jgi:ribulose-5-phosphate 4-epimerase/fuculose-1-phosphate aldolase